MTQLYTMTSWSTERNSIMSDMLIMIRNCQHPSRLFQVKNLSRNMRWIITICVPADLLERYKYFRQYGKDALLLTVLAYNVGHSRLLGYGKRPKSNLIKKIESCDRDIYEEYISYRCYKGKPIPSIERRRKREFQLLYIP